MTVEPILTQPEYVAVVVCAECGWSRSAKAHTALGHLDNSEELELALARHKANLHPTSERTTNA